MLPKHTNQEVEIQQGTIETLLQELKSIKDTILQLDAKVDSSYHDLSTKVTDCRELNELITAPK